jgi:hypothetical protein
MTKMRRAKEKDVGARIMAAGRVSWGLGIIFPASSHSALTRDAPDKHLI